MTREEIKTCGQCDHCLPAIYDHPATCWQIDIIRRERRMPVIQKDDPVCEHAEPRIEFRLPILKPEFQPQKSIGREVWGWRWRWRDRDTGIQAWMRKHGVVG